MPAAAVLGQAIARAHLADGAESCKLLSQRAGEMRVGFRLLWTRMCAAAYIGGGPVESVSDV